MIQLKTRNEQDGTWVDVEVSKKGSKLKEHKSFFIKSSSIKTLIASKGLEYGEPEVNFHAINDLEAAFNYHYQKAQTPSLMTIQTMRGIFRKIGRIATGKNSIEHWKDIAGYAQIMVNRFEKEK